MTRIGRRAMLKALGAVGSIGLAGCQGESGDRTDTATVTTTASTTRSSTSPTTTEPTVPEPEPIETDRLVGAHYYTWYTPTVGPAGWTDDTVSTPVLGEYSSRDPAVVDQHVAWCLDHGIEWLSMSWWGPGSKTDETIRDAVVAAPLFDRIQFSILYEPARRIGSSGFDVDDEVARKTVREDFGHMAEHFFSESNYLHFDGRPVVYVYFAHAFRGDVAGLFDDIAADIGVRPYVVADVSFDKPPDWMPAVSAADALTTYDVYENRPDIAEVFDDRYERWMRLMHLSSTAVDREYIPVVTPGYDDTGIPDWKREDHPAVPPSPERFERLSERVLPHLADARAVLITSFNEWYEDTAIEPSEQDGTAYLDVVADRLATGESPEYEPPGPKLRFAFNETVDKHEDGRPLAIRAWSLRLLADGEPVRTYDIGDPETEPLFVQGVYEPQSRDGRTFRYFVGSRGETTLYLDGDLGDATEAVLRAVPVAPNRIEADVSLDGVRTDHVVFGSPAGPTDYRFSLES